MCAPWTVLVTKAAIDDLKVFSANERETIFTALEKLATFHDPTRAFSVCELRFTSADKPWWRLKVIDGKLKARVLFTVRRERRAIIVTAALVRDGQTYEIGEARYIEVTA